MTVGAAILKKYRALLAAFSLLALATVLLNGWIELKGRPPANLPIGLGAGDSRSTSFTVYERGLYVVSLRLDGTYDRIDLECKLGSLPLSDYQQAERAANMAPFPEDRVVPSPRNCAPDRAALSWSIYRRGVLVGQDTPGPKNAVSRIVRLGKHDAELELGSIELSPGRDYTLEVRSRTDARALGLRHPTVRLALHVWDTKNGVGLLLLLLPIGLGAGTTFILLVISMLADIWRTWRTGGAHLDRS